MASDNESVAALLRALVLLQLEMLRDRPDAPKPEILLRRAGLEIASIADLLGKNYEATAKVLSRAKVSGRRTTRRDISDERLGR